MAPGDPIRSTGGGLSEAVVTAVDDRSSDEKNAVPICADSDASFTSLKTFNPLVGIEKPGTSAFLGLGHISQLEDHLYGLNMTAAVAALLIATAPLAYAQMGTAPLDATVTAVTSLGGIIQPDQIRASKMIGSVVYDVENVDIGKVQDVILDRNGRVASVVVDVGTFLGMGGKNVAVRLSDIKTDNNRLTLDLTKELLQRAQTYQLENPDISPVGGKLGSGAGSNTAPRQ